MNKLHVLFLASWYPNKLKPQNGNFIKRHAEAVSAFCKVSVIHVRANIQKEKFIIDINKTENLHEYICYYKKHTLNIPLISHFIKINKKIKAYKKTYRLISEKQEKINIIHLNVMLPAGIYALVLKKKYKIPYVITEHWTKFLNPSEFSSSEKKIIRKIAKNSSGICPVSENLKQNLINFEINGNFAVIPNVVNANIFYPETKETKHKIVKILHISHLDDKHKNISGILNVIKKLSSERGDFTITISGNRNLEQHKKYAKKIGIPENIISFEGEKTSEEVAESMRKHDIFVMFSNYENLPCVISEAHMCGIPVISSDVGGVSEMIDKDNGILTEKGNEKDFKEKLSLMIDNIEKYSPLLISIKAQNRYGYETVAKKYLTLYEKILNK
ncbi:MAG: glycosyltransferase [Bacteroidales bacterium]|nr:glycosyltransferase [Bacteroidales bacterium]